MQLDKVVKPAGVFAPARTYSLVRDADGLYLIFTGRAMGYVAPQANVAGAISGAILDKMAQKRLVGIEQVEAQIRGSSAAALKDTKHSFYFPRQSIKAIEFKKGVFAAAFPVVVVKAEKTLKLHFQQQDEATVREFFAPFTAQA